MDDQGNRKRALSPWVRKAWEQEELEWMRNKRVRQEDESLSPLEQLEQRRFKRFKRCNSISPGCSRLLNLPQNALDEIAKHLDHGNIATLRRSCRFAKQAFGDWSGIRVYCENFSYPQLTELSYNGIVSRFAFRDLFDPEFPPPHTDIICTTESGVCDALSNWEETIRRIRAGVNQSKLCVLSMGTDGKALSATPEGGFTMYIWKGTKCWPEKGWRDAKRRYWHNHDMPLRWNHEVGESALSEHCLRMMTFYKKRAYPYEDQRYASRRLHHLGGTAWVSPDVAFRHRVSFPPYELWYQGKRGILAFYCLNEFISTDKDLWDKRDLCAIHGMPMVILQILCLDERLMSVERLDELGITDQRQYRNGVVRDHVNSCSLQ